MTVGFPLPTTTLVGRASERDVLLDHLRRGARLVTLTGLGGMGKTRLAVEACLALAPRRVAYCHAARLAPADGLEGLAWAIAAALEVSPSADLLRVDPMHALASMTRVEAPHVIVLDDFEHLADIGAAAIERWLFSSPPTVLIVTSRRTLGSASEHVIAVEPLPPEHAAELLLTRARQRVADWGADDRDGVVHLAAHLEGIPLAIELAASHARVGGPGALLRLWRARHTDPRVTSRDVAVRWSWDHLDDAARRDLTTLAVITGAFDLELAAAALERSPDDAIVRVAGLVRDCLVATSSGPTPYRLLDTVREFVLTHGAPDVLASANDALTTAVLTRAAPVMTRRLPLPPGLATRLRADHATLEAIVRRGLDAPNAQRLDAAFQAATIIAIAVQLGVSQVQPSELLARLCVETDASSVALDRRITYIAELVVATDCVSRPLETRVVERFEQWLAESDDIGASIRHRWRLAASLARSWRFRDVAELLRHLELPPDAEPRLVLLATFMRLMLAQKLGTLTPDAPLLAEFDRLVDDTANTGRLESAVAIINQAYFAAQLARPGALDAMRASLARFERLGLAIDASYLAREIGRAEIDQGRLEAGITRLGAVVAVDALPFGAERLETRLELAAAQLEAGDLEGAAANLGEVAPWSGASSYIAAYHSVLHGAHAWLSGNAPLPALFTPTDTTEDAGFAVWAALGTRDLDVVCRAAAPVAPINARVRQALRVANAVLAIRAGRAFAVALDGAAFRAGDVWIDLRKRPVLGALLNLLVDAAARERGRTISKEQVAAHLWPGERMEPATRDNRLHVTVASLRKLGLGTAVVHRDGGFGIDPGCALLRVDPRALP